MHRVLTAIVLKFFSLFKLNTKGYLKFKLLYHVCMMCRTNVHCFLYHLLQQPGQK